MYVYVNANENAGESICPSKKSLEQPPSGLLFSGQKTKEVLMQSNGTGGEEEPVAVGSVGEMGQQALTDEAVVVVEPLALLGG